MAYERDERGYRREDRYEGSGRYREDPRDRGFFERASDEVRSWFGDEEAERRRRRDERYDGYSDVRRDEDRYVGERSYDAGRGYSVRDDQDRGRFSDREVGGYRSPDRYPNWARSNQDESRGGYARGYAPNSQHFQDLGSGESRQFADQPLRSAMGYRSAGDTGMTYGEAAERRRRENDYRSYYRDAERDQRDERRDDPHGYHAWRSRQVDQFDRDYDEYRRENQSRFEQEFATWRETRQRQRDSLYQVNEHQEVLGSDGEHVGVVDHVRGDRILLTKSDRDAGGHHHSIPSSWIERVDEKVHIRKSAAEAKRVWRDEEENQGLFERGERSGFGGSTASGTAASAGVTPGTGAGSLAGGTQAGTAQAGTSQTGASTTGSEGDRKLDRSFSGTY